LRFVAQDDGRAATKGCDLDTTSCFHPKLPFRVTSGIGVTYNSRCLTLTLDSGHQLCPRTVAFTWEARNEETPKEQLKSSE